MSALSQFVPIVSVLVIYAARMAELRVRRETVPGKVQETWTLRAFIFIGTGCMVGGVIEHLMTRGPWPWWTFITGWACAIGSILLRRSAIQALGRFWSLHVEIRDSHEIVTSGPFRWVRHPTYLSMVLELVGLVLILQAWVTGFVAGMAFVPALAARLRLEEAALVEKFGDAYRLYQRTTPLLFPFKRPCK